MKVLTYRNDKSRSGVNPNETQLTWANVNVNTFGMLFRQPVDGQVYAQPLYVPNLTVNGAQHNVVLVATENNSVYAFDADNNAGLNANALWQLNYNTGPDGITVTPVPYLDTGSGDIFPQIGITGTPVIDPATNILYVVVKTKEVSQAGTSYVLRLHAIDITIGQDALPPVAIQASVIGVCGNSDGNGNIVFDPLVQHQRAGLLLANGIVYIAWGSHGDQGSYNGWLLGYKKNNLAQIAVFNTSAANSMSSGDCESGIWMAGSGIAADAKGNIFFSTGNGGFVTGPAGLNYGDSVLKLAPIPGGAVSVADSFTPSNQGILDAGDADLGASGVILLPDQPGPNPHLMVTAGKTGTVFLINRDNMGGYNTTANNIVQELDGAINPDSASPYPPPIYFGGGVYYAAGHDNVKRFRLLNGTFQPQTPVAQSQAVMPYAGAGLSLTYASSNKNPILWALEGSSAPGVLHAYRANLVELYNTSQAAGGRDIPDPPVNFAIPTIANGKVYVGTTLALDVYGLLPSH